MNTQTKGLRVMLGFGKSHRRTHVHTPADEQNAFKPVDTRSPFEKVRDNYDTLILQFEDRKVRLERILEQAKTDLSECEAILLSLDAGRTALNGQIVERGLLGNDEIEKAFSSE
jgi:hypothetical protein